MEETREPEAENKAILVVDDDDTIRDLAERILKRGGYQVLTAVDGKEALAVYKRERQNIALVILDLVMPEMGGKECLASLLKINAAARVLISTGASADDEAKAAVKPYAKGFVNKPYGVKGLLQAVRDTLEEDC